MTFPKDLVGRCPICGDNADKFTDEDGVESVETSSSGYTLIYYQGEVMCTRCRQERINIEQSYKDYDLWLIDEQMRQRLGFRRTFD